MKEKLYTIELHDAMKSGDECPFCYMERDLEQKAIEFVLGSSYMESDTRDQTDRQGFCRHHTKMMYDYGNTLGNAWILKSRMKHMREGLKKEMASFKAEPAAKFSLFKKKEEDRQENSVSAWIHGEESHCYVCTRIDDTYRRVLDTFFYQVKHEPEFLELVKQSKGFCIHHFADLMNACMEKLDQKERDRLLPVLFEQMNRELDRIQEDIDWMIEKFDYLNKDKDWKNSRDAVQRAMQKIVGGHPADPVFKAVK